MNDKTQILEEARREAKEELQTLQSRINRYSFFAIGTGLGIGFFIFHFWFKMGFIWSMLAPFVGLVMPFVLYFGFRSRLAIILAPYVIAVESLEKEPQTATDYANRASAFNDHEFYDAAVDDYRTALALEPNNDYVQYSLAEVLWLGLHQEDEALAIVEKLSKTEGEFQAEAFALQGKILAEKDSATALNCFDKAIEIEPHDYEHHLLRLRVYIDSEQFDRAVEAIKETNKLLKRHNGMHYYSELCELRGLLAMKQSRFADAVKELTVAIRHCPLAVEHYRLRSDAYEALGYTDKAEADRRKVQELGSET